jgi:hypothetical protein
MAADLLDYRVRGVFFTVLYLIDILKRHMTKRARHVQ